MNSNRGTIPVAFFGIAVGALAFANLWRVAIRVWMAIRMVEQGATGPLESAAPGVFIAANVVIGILVVKTLGLLVQGKLISPAAAARVVPQAPGRIAGNARVARLS